MKNNLEIIEAALQQLFNGDSAPSFASDDFKGLVQAIQSLSLQDHSRVGAMALNLLLARLLSGMHAERSLKIMRGDGFKTL